MSLLEFTVLGPPISHQCKNPVTLQAWRAKVLAEATKNWGGKAPLTGRLQCTIMNFYEGHHPPCDDDNMVKPIRDAMNKVVFDDDKQITHSYTVQISINDPVQIRRTAMSILAAYALGDEFLYVRIDDAPKHIQLPQ